MLSNEEKNLIVGIDPGLNGALVFIEKDTRTVVEKRVIPKIDNVLDINSLDNYIQFHQNQIYHTFLEKVHAMPRQGVSSTFKFGRVFGIIEALLVAHRLPYTLITPASWSKEMHRGVEKSLEPKKRSIIAAKRLFPDTSLVNGDRSKKPHDGIVDALLIAEYGRRILS